MNLSSSAIWLFGPFRLNSPRRLLMKDGVPIDLGSRALDILIILVESAGEVVSQRELITRVWGNLVVDEANLRVHISRLRKTLESLTERQMIVTTPGRGYSFVAPVRWVEEVAEMGRTIAPASVPRRPRIPQPSARMIGREETISTLKSLLKAHRFVSIVGAGGMGKTTVALALAHQLRDEFSDAVQFVDLHEILEPSHLVEAISSALGFQSTGDRIDGLVEFFGRSRHLLVLDNCEHLVDATAQLAERLFQGAPNVHILTTSRQALRVEGEQVYLLRPLELPGASESIPAVAAMRASAVQLFMNRAYASGWTESLTDEDAPLVVDICRRLDGIALAIELGASRVGKLGISGTAELLGRRIPLLWQGRRDALTRHQTLQAMLDWSYDFLPESERLVLRRLAVFVGAFTEAAALTVVADRKLTAAEVADSLVSLSDKSLVWVEADNTGIRYRLLDTTRAYAMGKLSAEDDADTIALRHASHFAVVFSAVEPGVPLWEARDLSPFSPYVGDVQQGLTWCFGQTGNSSLGCELASRASFVLLGMSRLDECYAMCERARKALDELDRGGKIELMLLGAQALAGMFSRSNSPDILSSIERGLCLAESHGDAAYHLHLLVAMYIFQIRAGNVVAHNAIAKRSVEIAKTIGNSHAMAMADWMIGISMHFAGDQAQAQHFCERGLQTSFPDGLYIFIGDYFRIGALAALSRTLWLRGHPERALQVAAQAIEEGERSRYPINFCVALIYSTTVYLWADRFAAARQNIRLLLEQARRYSSCSRTSDIAVALDGELNIRLRNVAEGVCLLKRAITNCETVHHEVLATPMRRALAEGFLAIGDLASASQTIDAALERARANDDGCDLAN